MSKRHNGGQERDGDDATVAMDIPRPHDFIRALNRLYGEETLRIVDRWAVDAYREGNRNLADFWWRVADMIGPQEVPAHKIRLPTPRFPGDRGCSEDW